MSSYGFSSIAATNGKPSGIASVTMDFSSGGDYSETLSELKDTKFTQSFLNDKNQYGSEKAHSIEAMATFKYNLMDGTNIALLPKLHGSFHNLGLTLINGNHVLFGNSTVGHAGVPMMKLSIEGGASAHRYLEMTFKRRAVIGSSSSSVLDNDLIWSTFTSAGDGGLFTGNGYRTSSGFKSFNVRNVGETNYESLGPIKNGKFTATFQCDEDEEGRYIPRNTVLIDYSVDLMDHSSGTLAVLDTFHQAVSNDLKIVFMDNMTMTFADNLGAIADPKLEGDVSTGGIITIHGSGEILLSAFAATIS